MAEKQVDGSAVTTSSTDNNGGATLGLGADATNMKNVSRGRREQPSFASTVIDGAQTDKDVSGGTFAFDNNRGVIRRVNTTVANGVTAPAEIQSASTAVDNRRKFHSNETDRFSNIGSGLRNGSWNIVSGVFDPALTGVVTNFHSADGGGTIDEAVADVRSRPGQLVYRDGSGTPVTDDYEAKNG